MKTITNDLLESMFSTAQEKMIEEGWKEQEINTFLNDPVIKLFYGSCAEELGKLNEEVSMVENRLIQRTVEHLIPEVFQMPSPAHAILHIQPVNKLVSCQVRVEHQYNIFKELRGKEYTFTPAGNFTSYKAEVSHLIFRDRFFTLKDGSWLQIMSAANSEIAQDDVLWVGIKDLNRCLPIGKLNLFFSLKSSIQDEQEFLNTLKYCKCITADGKPVQIISGISSEDLSHFEYSVKQPDFMIYRLFQNTREWYRKNYLTLVNIPENISQNGSFPQEFSNKFPKNELDKIKDDIYWLKFSFSNLLNTNWIQKLYCSINCFPIVNLRLEQRLFDVEEMPVNIYPISSDDFIMAIRNIGGKVKQKEEELNYNLLNPELKSSLSKEGDAIFKRGSLGRITAQKLKIMLNQLLAALREEIVLLTRDGTKEDIQRLNRLHQAAVDFENRLEIEKEKTGKYIGSVILKAFKDQSKVYIRYWTTAAENANMIKPLELDEGQKQSSIGHAPDVSSESLRLITPSAGGKKQPSDEEYIDTLRKLLLTRTRIVTAEDIKAFCYEYFHPNKVTVEVGKSVRQSERPGHGLVRTIEIKIRFANRQSFSQEDMRFYKEELTQVLEQHSANVMPFHISFH